MMDETFSREAVEQLRKDVTSEQMNRLERKLDWLHWALVEVDTHRLYGAGYTDKEIQRLHMMTPPWPGDLP